MTAENPLTALLKPHALSPLPETPEQRAAFTAQLGGPSALMEWLRKRAEKIERATQDPLRFGWETTVHRQPDGSLKEWLPHWTVLRQLYAGTFTHQGTTFPPATDILLLGGKRGSKTEPAAKFAVESLYTPGPGSPLRSPRPLHESGLGMVTNAGRNVWCWIMDETSSIDRQQQYIYRYLLPEHRELGKRGHGNIKYTRKGGFSERHFVLPAERPELCSAMRFFTYHQFRQDPDCAEGGETDFIWLDEPPPEELLETLRFRNITRNGKLLVSFNPKNGYTVSVGQYLDGAHVLLDRRAQCVPSNETWVKGCRPGHMPFVIQCHRPGRWIVVAYTELNPFNDMARLTAEMVGAKMQALKIHFYGWPERLEGVAFPRFGDVHIIEPDQVPAEGTDYVIIDPAGDRNWFMLWIRVDSMGRMFVWQEWPDSSYGEWTVASRRPDGARGPAQTVDGGKGISEYKRILLQLSGWERDAATGRWSVAKGRPIQEFIGDPRGFGTQVAGHETGTSIQDMLLDEQVDKVGVVSGPSIDLVLAPATGVEEGKGMINDALSYDDQLPLNVLNSPKLFISRKCQNTIYCLRTWTGLDGERGASKDPIDCLRYALKSGIEFIGAERMRSTGVRCY